MNNRLIAALNMEITNAVLSGKTNMSTAFTASRELANMQGRCDPRSELERLVEDGRRS